MFGSGWRLGSLASYSVSVSVTMSLCSLFHFSALVLDVVDTTAVRGVGHLKGKHSPPTPSITDGKHLESWSEIKSDS